MKYCFVLILFVSCKNISFDQKAFNFNNKGITKDATVDPTGTIYICGESSIYISEKINSSGKKDACIMVCSADGKSNRAYSFGNPDQNERFERILLFDNAVLLSGYSGETKNKFLMKTTLDGNSIWGIQSPSTTTFEHRDLAMDPSGNILLATKNPEGEPYLGFLHLIDKNGSCQWTKKLQSIEIMQDIICTIDSHYIISFKQKGAYIDGSTRKKYWMNAFHKLTKNGEIIWSKKFILEVDKVNDCNFNKILEDPKGNLYFIGKIELVNKKAHELYIVKTDLNGTIYWSSIYGSSSELEFKNACFTEKGNILMVGDGYGKNGGLVYLELIPNGDVLWSYFKPIANYEQVLTVLPNKKNYTIIWDKLLNFAAFTIGEKGTSCYSDIKEIKLNKQNFPILLDSHRGNLEDVPTDWGPLETHIVIHKDVKFISECP